MQRRVRQQRAQAATLWSAVNSAEATVPKGNRNLSGYQVTSIQFLSVLQVSRDPQSIQRKCDDCCNHMTSMLLSTGLSRPEVSQNETSGTAL